MSIERTNGRKYELKERAESVAATRRADRRGDGRAARAVRACSHDDQRDRRARRRPAPDRLPPLPRRALPVRPRAPPTGRRSNPAPDPADWAPIRDPEERLRTALERALCLLQPDRAHDRQLLRDLPQSAALQQVAKPVVTYAQRAREVLDEGWNVRGRKRTVLRAAIGHALDFETWRSLSRRESLGDQAAAEAMVKLVLACRA